LANRSDPSSNTPRSGLETWSQQLDFAGLAEQYGTPTYILNANRLEENVRSYLHLIDEPSRILYPVKTNPSFAVLRRLADLGCGMDCASRDEVDCALVAGVPYERISYNTPAPEFGLIRNLLKAGATVVADSEDLLLKINQKIPPSHVIGALFLRLNIDAGGEYLQHYDWENMVHHGASSSKFGIPAEEVVKLLNKISLPVRGLHVHVGTMMDNLQTFENMMALLHQLVDRIHALTSHRIAMINLGGGLGIHFVPGQTFPSIIDFAERLKPLKQSSITYYVEPGQSLVGDTMGLLTRVVALKEMRGKRWAIIDVGSDQLMKITTVSWYHQILDQWHQPLAMSGTDAVGGPLCFAGDTILPTTSLTDVKIGAVLFLQHAGAYLEAVANRFNGRRSAGLIVMDREGIHRATHSEDPFFSPPIQTYEWAESYSRHARYKDFDAAQIELLRSQYFARHVHDDHSQIVQFRQTGPNSFLFQVDVQASVDFVSVPFAMRITADAVIIAVLIALGKQCKDVSVWGSKGTFTYREPIQPGKEIQGTITLSPLAPVPGGKLRLNAVATLDQKRFSMSSEIVV
jgi:diaminopimelate decarboxylase